MICDKIRTKYGMKNSSSLMSGNYCLHVLEKRGWIMASIKFIEDCGKNEAGKSDS